VSALILEVRGLEKRFAASGILQRGRPGPKAVDGVSFAVEAGSTFGLVGESGCGKTTLARSLLYLDPPTAGQVLFEGKELGALSRPALRKFRRHMQIVFQDPNGALDPKMSIRASMGEGLENLGVKRGERRRRIDAALQMVGIQPAHAERYPHEFSGGQKQRITIARALSVDPRLLVLDEPVSNLDVSIQAQIINLLLDIKRRLALTYLFISHDLNLVAYLADRIAVMFRGRIVELGSTAQILEEPLHPYTRRLFASVPRLTGERIAARMEEQAQAEEASRASNQSRPGGSRAGSCRYAERCARGELPCVQNDPGLMDAGGGHLVACLKPEKPNQGG
jgi:oligopeptide/dipeptide ABC transporter ATP-binding protein